jgi:hypothetical protein
MRTLILSSTLVIVLASLTIGWRAAQAVRAVETERAALAAAQAAQVAERRKLEQRLETQGRERDELQATLAATRTPAKPMAAKPGSGSSDGGKNAAPGAGAPNLNELMARDPKLQSLYLASRRAAFATSYGPFLASRGLTPEQEAKLLDARMKAHEQDMDLRNIMTEQKLSLQDPAVMEMRQRTGAELQAAMVAVLGEAGYAEFQRYDGTLPAREMAERFAGAAAIGDVPITAQQAEQLTQIMATAAGVQPGRGIDPTRIDWAAVDAQAARVLSPVQLALFRRIEPVGGGASRWGVQLNRALQEARARGSNAPTPGK